MLFSIGTAFLLRLGGSPVVKHPRVLNYILATFLLLVVSSTPFSGELQRTALATEAYFPSPGPRAGVQLPRFGIVLFVVV